MCPGGVCVQGECVCSGEGVFVQGASVSRGRVCVSRGRVCAQGCPGEGLCVHGDVCPGGWCVSRGCPRGGFVCPGGLCVQGGCPGEGVCVQREHVCV